jgi:hypothetical protein
VKCADYDCLVELATICSLCNDSSVDYNEVNSFFVVWWRGANAKLDCSNVHSSLTLFFKPLEIYVNNQTLGQ